MSADLPAGYQPVEIGDARGFALGSATGWLAAVLREHGSIRAWAEATGASTLGGGRADVRLFTAPTRGPDERNQWVCRALHRGGAARLLGDRYAGRGERRPLAELRASLAVRARGVRTPAVVAGAVYSIGPFYRADVVTEHVPASRSLAEELFGGASSYAPTESLHRAGRLVGQLERARVVHRDLNAGNVLLPSAGRCGDAWVVDLDRCRILPADARWPSQTMRRRLERSLAKLGRRHDRSITHAELELLRAGYEHP